MIQNPFVKLRGARTDTERAAEKGFGAWAVWGWNGNGGCFSEGNGNEESVWGPFNIN